MKLHLTIFFVLGLLSACVNGGEIGNVKPHGQGTLPFDDNTYTVNEETKTVCNSRDFNGTYEVNLVRQCKSPNADKPEDWGSVTMEINDCILGVNDLYGATLKAEPMNVETWKTLKGVVDKEGRVSGIVFLKPVIGIPNPGEYVNFFGKLREREQKSRLESKGYVCKFTFHLKKI